MLNAHKRFFALFVCLTLCLQLFIVTTYAADSDLLQDGIINLGCASVTDAVQIADSAELVIVDGSYKTLYKVDFLTGDVKSADLELTPNSVDYFGDQIYVGCGAQSSILIYDLYSLTLIDTIPTEGTFIDMKTGNDGYIYTIGTRGSPWWDTFAQSYSVTEKRMVSSIATEYNGILEKHPHYNSFYFTRQGVSPSDVHVFTYDNGQIKTTYESRYHGEYVTGRINRITPDGNFLINSTGNIARVSSVQSEDIVFSFALGKNFSDLCFDADNDRFFTVSDKTITQYKTSTLEKLNSFETERNADRIFSYGGHLAALEKNTNGLYYIERINIDAVPLPEALVPSTETLTQTDNKFNLDIDNLVASRFIEQTGELLMLSPTYLYKINIDSNIQTKIRFPYSATKLSVYDNTVFVGAGRQGVVCLYDLQTMNYIKTIFTEELFLGMEVGNDGYLYTGETGAWETARCSFNVETGERVERVKDIYGKADYVKSPTESAFYYTDNWEGFAQRTYSNGKITATKSFGDINSGKIVDISLDGMYIFMDSGKILKCNLSDDTVSFFYKIAVPVVDARFAESRNSVYAALSEKLIYAYDYDTFEGTATYETQGYPQYINVHGDTLISVSKATANSNSYGDNTGTFFIETIDLNAPKTTIETTVTTKSLSYADGRAKLGVKSNAKTVWSGDKMYIADNSGNAAYAIDTANMTETKITFPNAPNSLYYYNNELFVGFGNNGTIAVLDAETYEAKDRFVLGTTFFDFAIGNDGNIYIVKNMQSFSRATGQRLSNNSSSYSGYLAVSPSDNSMYFSRQGVSPGDLHTIKYENGIITSTYDSPYHGDYPIGTHVRISPDGKHAFTSSGSVFICSNVRAEDMKYKSKFITFTDLAFDLANNQMFVSQNGANVSVYDYATYEKTGFIKTAYPIKSMTVCNDDIIAVSSDNNSYYLEMLSLSNILEVQPEEIIVSVADKIHLTKTGYYNLTPSLFYNDGTSKSVTDTAVYTSSDTDVVSVTANGRVTAESFGAATVTIECEGISTQVSFVVDVSLNNIEVEGYDVYFSPDYLNYTVFLPNETTEVPAVSYDADEGLDVEVIDAVTIPGTTLIIVTDEKNGLETTYSISFYLEPERPPVSDDMPYELYVNFVCEDGKVKLDIEMDYNYSYEGWYYGNHQIVIQLFDENNKPLLATATGRVGRLFYMFDEKYTAYVSVVDRFGDKDYIGVPLAYPIVVNSDGFSYIVPEGGSEQ